MSRTLHHPKSRVAVFIRLVVAAAVAVVLLVPWIAGAPKLKIWGKITEVSAPTVLTNWDTSGANSTTEHTLQIEVKNLDEDVFVTMPQADPLTGKKGPVLTTTWKFSSDGDGFSESGIQSGGSYGGVSYADQGHNNFVSAANLMNPGVVLTYVDPDEEALIFTTSRGINSEDFGSDSDSTEAPDYGATYEADMELQLEFPVP